MSRRPRQPRQPSVRYCEMRARMEDDARRAAQRHGTPPPQQPQQQQTESQQASAHIISILASMDTVIQNLRETLASAETYRARLADTPVFSDIPLDVFQRYEHGFRSNVSAVTTINASFSSLTVDFDAKVQACTKKQRRATALLENKPTAKIAEGDMCAICLSDIFGAPPETLAQLKRCKHIYCKGCVTELLHSNTRTSILCPQCRVSIF
jgi:hypothetical protein